MDLLTTADLEHLAHSDHDGAHLSLFIPTHRYGQGTAAARIGWKNLLAEVESVLAERGTKRQAITELLAPAWALHGDDLAWQYMSDGLAFFIQPEWHQAFRVPVELPTLGTVGDRFLVGPLQPMVTADNHYLVLAVSQRRVRLLEGTRQRVEQVELKDVPTDLREVIEQQEPRSDTMTRLSSASGSGHSGLAVFYGHGAADEHYKKEDMRRFMRLVATGLRDVLAGRDLPMVLVGLEAALAMYREVNTYQHLLKESSEQNPDQLSVEELHAASWPIISDLIGRQHAQIIRKFEELHGTGRASSDLDQIVGAAAQGRIETLLTTAEAESWQDASESTVVQLGEQGGLSRRELVDRAVVDTLSRSGQVHPVPATELPGGGDLAAIFRY